MRAVTRISVFGGTSVKVRTTEDTGKPSDVAIDCAMAVRSASEIAVDGPECITVVTVSVPSSVDPSTGAVAT